MRNKKFRPFAFLIILLFVATGMVFVMSKDLFRKDVISAIKAKEDHVASGLLQKWQAEDKHSAEDPIYNLALATLLSRRGNTQAAAHYLEIYIKLKEN